MNKTTGTLQRFSCLIFLLRLRSVFKSVDEAQFSKHFPCAPETFCHHYFTTMAFQTCMTSVEHERYFEESWLINSFGSY